MIIKNTKDVEKAFLGITTRARVSNYIAANPGATIKQACKDLCISKDQITKAIADLIRLKQIKEK